MKKLKSIILTTVILTLICAVSTAALAFTNKLTDKRIAEASVKAEQKAMARIVKADEYTLGTVSYKDDQSGKIQDYNYCTAVTSGETNGYIFTVSANGYGGAVKVMIGINTEGKVIAIEVLDASNETPGLGQNVTKKDFWKQFEGKSGNLTVKDTVEAVTGATISSKAVTQCVNTAFELYDVVTKEGGVNG